MTPLSASADSIGAASGHSARALVVLGMHRSGTSAMSRVLGLSGGRLPDDPHPPGFDNPEGFWESRSVIALNEEILAAFDSSWEDLFAGRPRPYLSNFDGVYLQRAVDVLSAAFARAPLIVLKDPRINVLAAFWDRAVRACGYEPTYVVMVRHPAEVAASLRERNGLPTEAGLLLWLDNMCAAERDTRGARRVFVTYPDLMDRWDRSLDRIEHAAGMPLPLRSSASRGRIESFLKPELRHQRFLPGSQQDFSAKWPDIAAGYEWFLRASRDEVIDYSCMDQIEARQAQMGERIGPILADMRLRASKDRSEVASAQQVSERLREQQHVSLATQTAAEERVLAQDAVITALSAERRALETRIEEALDTNAAEVVRLTRLNAQLNEEVSAGRDEVAAHAHRIAEAKRRSREFREALRPLIDMFANIATRAHSDLRRLESEVHGLAEDNMKLRSELAVSTSAGLKAATEIDGLTSQLNQLSSLQTHAGAELERERAHFKELQEHVNFQTETLRKEIAIVRSSHGWRILQVARRFRSFLSAQPGRLGS